MTAGTEARRYLRGRRQGVLSTLSKKLDGYPYGSVVPYMLDHDARPVVLISRLAEHTKNINADPRVSLLVHEPAADVQAGARMTLLGNAALIDQASIRSRYLRFFPQAGRLLAFGDFSFYTVSAHQLRFIGGFGDIHWISAESYATPSHQLAADEDSIIEYMNREHVRNLHDYCRVQRQKTAQAVGIIGIDCDGFDVRADGEILRFDFEKAVHDASEARQRLAGMVTQARTG